MRVALGERAYVGLGANLGDARATLEAALEALSRLAMTTLAARSSLYRSAPIDAGGPDFINAVAVLDTALSPETLLAELMTIEQHHGRLRSVRNAPRTLDLDLLIHGDAARATPELTLPHPRLHERAFVLLPLLEVEPSLRLPGLGLLAARLPAVAGQRVTRLVD